MKKFLSIALAAAGTFSVFADAVPTPNQGWELLNKGKYAESEKVFRTIAANGEGNNKFVGTTGVMFALRRQKKNADVVKEVDAWIAANKDATADQKAALLNFKGNALRDTGKFDEAEAAYKQGIELKSVGPASGDCAKECIVLFMNKNDFEAGKKIYEEASKQPVVMKNVGFLINSATLMWRAKNAEEGMKLITAAEQAKHPQWLDENIFRVKGYILRDLLKKYEEAIKEFEKALAVPKISATQQAVLWNNIGMAYEQDEEYEKAVEAYKKVGTCNATGWFIKSAAASAARLQKRIDAGE